MKETNRKKYIEQLKRRSEESLEEAKLLYKEGHYNGAISRAYYAMFYLAQAVLATKDIARSKHYGVIAAFGEKFAKQGVVSQKFHKLLMEAYEERRVSDYEVGVVRSKNEAKRFLSDAREFCKGIDEYLDRWLKGL